MSRAFATLHTGAVGCLALAAAACVDVNRVPSPVLLSGPADVVANRSQPGEPIAEPATWHSLGIRWPIRGDANASAGIGVQYRRRGETSWTEVLPLARTDPEATSEQNRVPGGWLFARSIVDLLPETGYEVALSPVDVDGGSTQRLLLMRTGGEPREPAGMSVRHVVPGAAGARGPGTGSVKDPFRGLLPHYGPRS